MKEFRTKEGPFPVRLLYEIEEIDQICTDALRSKRLLPTEPEPIKIDLFLERYFGVIVDYKDLGDGIMGSTVFNSMGVVTGFIISPKIEEDGTTVGERRSRSTLAHEGGHGLLHPRLFMKDQTGDLFGGAVKPTKSTPNFLCRNSDIGAVGGIPKYDGRWWEWQANRAIGGLLLPKKLVATVAACFTSEGNFGPELPEAKRTELEREIAKTFDVNPAVARIRVAEMFPVDREQKRL